MAIHLDSTFYQRDRVLHVFLTQMKTVELQI